MNGAVQLLASSNLSRCGFFALTVLNALLVYGQATPGSQSKPSKSSLPQKKACGCPDGRRFSIGASVFGKNSSRVLITGLRPEPPSNTSATKLTQCTDLLVVGQIIRLLNTPEGRPFLQRENLKRGIIHDICDTKIQFVEAKKSYDFFAEDGDAVTLTENDVQPQAPNNSEEAEFAKDKSAEESDDLTGQDLLRLAPKQFGRLFNDPSDFAFDEDDLKEGAYLVCRKRLKATLAHDGNLRTASVSRAQSGDDEISLRAATVGRIDKSAGVRPEPLWIVDVLPDSAPKPFWQSLLSLPRTFREPNEVVLPKKVILGSSQVLEINHFLDQAGIQSTRFRSAAIRDDHDTSRLPELFATPELSLEENIEAAQQSRVFAAIRNAAIGLRLIFKDQEAAARRGTLILEERISEGTPRTAVPDLLRRQCFLGLDKLNKLQEQPSQSAASVFVVTGVDVKVFQPKADLQVPPTYYAIDLELTLRPDFATTNVPLVCRFPSAPINLALVDMAERILFSSFEVQRMR